MTRILIVIAALIASLAIPVALQAAERPPRVKAASEFLERSLTIQQGSGTSFSYVNDDICHIRAVEGPWDARYDFNLSDIDINSIVMKYFWVWRSIVIKTAKDRHFLASEYDSSKKEWKEFRQVDAVWLLVGDSNEDNVLKALNIVAQDCGARPAF